MQHFELLEVPVKSQKWNWETESGAELFLSRCHSCYRSRRALFSQSQFTAKCFQKNSHSFGHRHKLQVCPHHMLFKKSGDVFLRPWSCSFSLFFMVKKVVSSRNQHTLTGVVGKWLTKICTDDREKILQVWTYLHYTLISTLSWTPCMLCKLGICTNTSHLCVERNRGSRDVFKYGLVTISQDSLCVCVFVYACACV